MVLTFAMMNEQAKPMNFALRSNKTFAQDEATPYRLLPVLLLQFL